MNATMYTMTQERYDRLIDEINGLPLDDYEKQRLIDMIDDFADYALTEGCEEM